MLYVVLVVRDRSITLLNNHKTRKKYFTDFTLAKKRLQEDFLMTYHSKTGKQMTNEDFESLKGSCYDFFGISREGDAAWINDIAGCSYDIYILKIEK